MFDSIFELIQSLSRGDFIPGFNRIKNSQESVLNLFSTFLDKKKMDLVRDLVNNQKNLHTVVLDPKILLDDSESTRQWLWDMNSLRLVFLSAECKQDIADFWATVDKNHNDRVSLDEFKIAGEYSRKVWMDKYGKDHEMNQNALLNFIRSENVVLNGTVFSVFEVAENENFPQVIQDAARNVIGTFFSRNNLKLDDSISIDECIKRFIYSDELRLGKIIPIASIT